MKNLLIDMVGQKFSRLTVIKRNICDKKDRNTYWECRCECGKDIVVSRNSLMSGNTKSCGCLQKDVTRNSYIDMTGRIFGRLTVIGKGKERSKYGTLRWLCRCECGKTKEISGITLRSGTTKSCGCLHADSMRRRILKNFGSGKHRLFNQYRSKALKKGRSFDLTEDDFLALTKED